jgi:hypothetical protein
MRFTGERARQLKHGSNKKRKKKIEKCVVVCFLEWPAFD